MKGVRVELGIQLALRWLGQAPAIQFGQGSARAIGQLAAPRGSGGFAASNTDRNGLLAP